MWLNLSSFASLSVFLSLHLIVSTQTSKNDIARNILHFMSLLITSGLHENSSFWRLIVSLVDLFSLPVLFYLLILWLIFLYTPLLNICLWSMFKLRVYIYCCDYRHYYRWQLLCEKYSKLFAFSSYHITFLMIFL